MLATSLPFPLQEESRRMPDPDLHDRPSTLDEARRLAESLAQGAQLEPLHVDGLPLVHGEHAYAEVDVEGWRWLAADVVYERRLTLLGGPVLMTVSALASAIGNRRRRLAAERISAPQWRPLGTVRVVATDRRLLVWHESAWWSVPFDAVAAWDVDAGSPALTLSLTDGAPYGLAGPSVPLLVVVLLWLAEHPVGYC